MTRPYTRDLCDGYRDLGGGKVVLLQRAVNGLRQASIQLTLRLYRVLMQNHVHGAKKDCLCELRKMV